MLIRSLAFIFFLSGLASLIYQVAWQRLLTLHYGVGHFRYVDCQYLYGRLRSRRTYWEAF